MSISTDKEIASVTYNGVNIPLKSGGGVKTKALR